MAHEYGSRAQSFANAQDERHRKRYGSSPTTPFVRQRTFDLKAYRKKPVLFEEPGLTRVFSTRT
jgi:hypothetical protein